MNPIIYKTQMSEEDIKLNYITPAIQAKGWQGYITMETKITAGKVNLRGNIVVREQPKKVDYLLYIRENQPIAVVEAKKNGSITFCVGSKNGVAVALSHSCGEGCLHPVA